MPGKTIVYQILPRLWGNLSKPVKGGSLKQNGCGRFSSLDQASLNYLHGRLGVTHVWLTGIIRHALGEEVSGGWAKGLAGSPYAICDYFDVNPYLADNKAKRLDEFKSLIKRIHASGMKVIIDFVPNHVARNHSPFFGGEDDRSVHWKAENDFFYYPGQALKLPFDSDYVEMPARASGNAFTPSPGINDWYETVKLNYCDFRTPTWDKMDEVLKYWCSFGVDGFRCDMVELIPWQAMQWLIAQTREAYPGTIFIAEVYQTGLYHRYGEEVGFDYLYDKSGLYDTLHDIITRGEPAGRISGVWQMLGDLQPHMLNFLENHDEQRLASDFFAGSASRSLAALHVSLLLNTAPFILYFGQEAGERGMDEEGFSGLDGRTSIFDWWSPKAIKALYTYIHSGEGLDSEQAALLARYETLLSMAREPLFGEGLTYDLCYCNQNSQGFDPDRHFIFLRSYKGKTALVAANFSSEDACMEISIPEHASAYLGIKKFTQTVKVCVKACDGTVVRL